MKKFLCQIAAFLAGAVAAVTLLAFAVAVIMASVYLCQQVGFERPATPGVLLLLAILGGVLGVQALTDFSKP